MKKAILKKKEVAGLSKMKAADLNQALADHFTEEELAQEFTVRGYQLTEKGKQALKDHQVIIDRYPKKNLSSTVPERYCFSCCFRTGEKRILLEN